MSVDGRYALDRVTGADLVAEATRWPLSPDHARTVVEETAAGLRTAVEGSDPTPELADLVHRRTTELLDSLPQ